MTIHLGAEHGSIGRNRRRFSLLDADLRLLRADDEL